MRTDALGVENRLVEVRDLASGQALMRLRYDEPGGKEVSSWRC
jgi:hypothetical protein